MATEDTSLESLFDAQPASSQPIETAPSEPVEAKGDKEIAPAPPADAQAPTDEGPLVPRKALEDERRKRQDYEKRLGELERKLQAPPPQQAKPQAPAPDWYVEPEQAAQQMHREFAYQIFETRLSLGEEIVGQNPGYADAKSAFVEAAQSDPSLLEKMVKHQNPAKFVFEQGRKLAAQREIGDDPVAYKERLRAELRAELGQVAPSPASPQPPKAPAPKSLAGTTSTARDPQGRFASPSGPASLEDILG